MYQTVKFKDWLSGLSAELARRLPLPYASATIRNKSKGVRLFHWSTFIPLYYSKPEYHSWVNYVTFSRLPCAMEGGEVVELSVKITNGVVVDKCGVHLISKEWDIVVSQAILIPCTSQVENLVHERFWSFSMNLLLAVDFTSFFLSRCQIKLNNNNNNKASTNPKVEKIIKEECYRKKRNCMCFP